MIWEAIKAGTAIAVLMAAWLLVQRSWRRAFARPAGEDALAGRMGCHGCTCETPCEDAQSRNTMPTTTQEGS